MPQSEPPKAEGRNHRSLTADFARQIFRDVDVEGNRRLREERTVNILVADPNHLAGFVVERSQHVRHIGDLTALVGELAGQGRIRRRIQLFIFDLNHGIGRSRNQG